MISSWRTQYTDGRLSMESHRIDIRNPTFRRCARPVVNEPKLPPRPENALIECRGPEQDFSYRTFSRRFATMRRIVSFFAVLTALALASTASAQVQTGSIFVRAVDDQGAV